MSATLPENLLLSEIYLVLWPPQRFLCGSTISNHKYNCAVMYSQHKVV